MRNLIIAVIACGALAACSAAPNVTPAASGKVTPASVCGDITAVASAPDAATQLAALDPHSALGVLWADAKAACPSGAPAAGVDASWTAQVWAMTKSLIPQVLPLLIGLI